MKGKPQRKIVNSGEAPLMALKEIQKLYAVNLPKAVRTTIPFNATSLNPRQTYQFWKEPQARNAATASALEMKSPLWFVLSLSFHAQCVGGQVIVIRVV